MNTLGDMIASIQHVTSSAWVHPPSWTIILWSALGCVVACAMMMIAMSINMHYRLKRSCADLATKAPVASPALQPAPAPLPPPAVAPASTLQEN